MPNIALQPKGRKQVDQPTTRGADLSNVELDVTSDRERQNCRVIHLAPTQFGVLHHVMRKPAKSTPEVDC